MSPLRPGRKRPAILWVAGGFNWGLSASAWTPAPRSNDQSARAFREAGIVLMRPALRGANDNPGQSECFLGEVDDILAAADYLAKRPDVDARRIYLGGHSTGGTLALLTAESTARFRAVFAFGPAPDPRQYRRFGGCLPDSTDGEEARLRAPIEFIKDIKTPTWIIEGKDQGFSGAYPPLAARAASAPVQFLIVPGATHFSVLAPASELIAAAILTDSGPTPHFNLTTDAIAHAVNR